MSTSTGIYYGIFQQIVKSQKLRGNEINHAQPAADDNAIDASFSTLARPRVVD